MFKNAKQAHHDVIYMRNLKDTTEQSIIPNKKILFSIHE